MNSISLWNKIKNSWKYVFAAGIFLAKLGPIIVKNLFKLCVKRFLSVMVLPFTLCYLVMRGSEIFPLFLSWFVMFFWNYFGISLISIDNSFASIYLFLSFLQILSDSLFFCLRNLIESFCFCFDDFFYNYPRTFNTFSFSGVFF